VTDPAGAEGGAADQVVPRLRNDLQVKAGEKQGTVEIGDGARMMALQDFEMSVARMMDGRRTHAQAVEAARLIGLPLSLESLTRFIAKLRANGLLQDDVAAEPAPAHPDRATWPPRSAWSEEERGLYQQALKAFREDRLKEAQAAIGQMLEKRPFAAEAVDLKARIDKALTGNPPSGFFMQAFNSTEAGWFAAGEKMASEPAPEDELALAAPKRRPWMWAVPLALVVAGMAVPLPRKISAGVTLQPAHESPLSCPHAGQVELVLVTEGQLVTPGTPVVKFDSGETKRALDKAAARASELAQLIKRADAASKSPKAAKAKAQQAKREAQLAKAVAEHEKLAKGKGKGGPALAKAEKQVVALTAEVKKGAAELEGLTQDKAAAAARDEFKALEDQKKALAAELAAPTFNTSEAGVVTRLSVKAGQKVAANDLLARLQDRKLMKAEVKLDARELALVHAGDAVSLSLGGVSVPSKVASVEADGVTVDVPNADLRLKPGAPGTVELDLGAASLGGRLLH